MLLAATAKDSAGAIVSVRANGAFIFEATEDTSLPNGTPDDICGCIAVNNMDGVDGTGVGSAAVTGTEIESGVRGTANVTVVPWRYAHEVSWHCSAGFGLRDVTTAYGNVAALWESASIAGVSMQDASATYLGECLSSVSSRWRVGRNRFMLILYHTTPMVETVTEYLISGLINGYAGSPGLFPG